MARFTIEAVIKQIDRVTGPQTKMGNKFRRTTRRMTDSVRRLNASMKKMAKTAGTAFGVAGMAGAVFLAKQALTGLVSLGADFEQTLVGAGARFGGIRRGTLAFKELEDQARLTGATTEFTSKQAAEGLNFLAKAGFNAKEAIALLPGIVDLATAAEIDMARAADISSDALGAFGLNVGTAAEKAANFARVSDAMAATVNTTNIDMERLFETISQGAPFATTTGIEFETFLAITGRLAQSTIKASKAGTQLKQVFTKLTDPKIQKAIKRMGVDVLETAGARKGELRDFADIVDDLKTKLAVKTGPQRAAILTALFGERGKTAMSIIVAEGTAALRELRTELRGAEGETGKLAAVIRDTLAGDIKQLTSAFEGLGLSIFKVGGTDMEGFVESLTDVVRGVDEFVKQNPGIVKVAGALLAIAVVGLVVAGVFAAIGAAVGFVMSSTAALIAILVGFAVAFGTMLFNGAKALGFFDALEETIQSVGETLGDVRGAISRFLGFGGGEEEAYGLRYPAGADVGDVIGPQRRGELNREESLTTSEVGLTIRDETGRASLDRPEQRIAGVGILLEATGTT